ncbi:MAG: chemotaxis protein CheW, partial [Thermoleophilia bacterium]|nr:chemotaxis protein CheW [Thermoleophilia bacterium]
MGSIDGIEAGSRVGRPWCFFRAGGAAYAVGLEAVSEVIEVERLVALPLCPPHILGLCNFRREV